MQIDHIHFYVEDGSKWREWFIQVMGFHLIASGCNQHTQTEVVNSSKVTFVISSPLNLDSPVAQFLRSHPSGVADIAFLVTNIKTILKSALAKGVKISQPLRQWYSTQGQLSWATITGITGLNHTLIERCGITPLVPQDWLFQQFIETNLILKTLNKNCLNTQIDFSEIDHIVLNVATNKLTETVTWYESILGFKRQQTFDIQTDNSALHSQVMIHPQTGIKLPINEPRSANSQIQEFLNLNRGPGIQHLALKTENIARVAKKLRTAGMSFLSVPPAYYRQLEKQAPHLDLSKEEWQEIKAQEILIDYQEDPSLSKLVTPLLLQIFTQPIFEQPTFFFELIERRYQAKGFGQRNFRALFEAIEREQLKRGSLLR